MKFLDKVRKDLQNLPHDERMEAVQQQASWKAMMVLIASYIAIGIYYAFRLQAIPFSTQLIFFIAVITYAYLSIKQDGLSFMIPGMPETEETLDQPAAIRSIPWITFFGGMVALLLVTINIFASFAHGDKVVPLFIIIPFVGMLVLVSLITNWALAYKIKQGSRFWINLILLGSVVNIIEHISNVISYLQHKTALLFVNPAIPTPASATILFTIAITCWEVWVLFIYRDRIIEDGKSYKKLKAESKSELDVQHDNEVRKLSIITLALFVLGFAGLALSFTALYIAPILFIAGIIALSITIIKSLIYS